MNIENIKMDAILFFTKYRSKIFASFGILALAGIGVFYKINKEKEASINSSNQLLDYIDGRSDDFLKSKHKKGYALIKEVIENRDNIAFLDKCSKLDDFVFKNLFYFAKRISFCGTDEYATYYESPKNPWSKLVLSANEFCLKDLDTKLDNSIRFDKPDYLILYLIGKGANV